MTGRDEGGGRNQREAREARLAKALRDNLRRRKAQRAPSGEGPADQTDVGEPPSPSGG